MPEITKVQFLAIESQVDRGVYLDGSLSELNNLTPYGPNKEAPIWKPMEMGLNELFLTTRIGDDVTIISKFYQRRSYKEIGATKVDLNRWVAIIKDGATYGVYVLKIDSGSFEVDGDALAMLDASLWESDFKVQWKTINAQDVAINIHNNDRSHMMFIVGDNIYNGNILQKQNKWSVSTSSEAYVAADYPAGDYPGYLPLADKYFGVVLVWRIEATGTYIKHTPPKIVSLAKLATSYYWPILSEDSSQYVDSNDYMDRLLINSEKNDEIKGPYLALTIGYGSREDAFKTGIYYVIGLVESLEQDANGNFMGKVSEDQIPTYDILNIDPLSHHITTGKTIGTSRGNLMLGDIFTDFSLPGAEWWFTEPLVNPAFTSVLLNNDFNAIWNGWTFTNTNKTLYSNFVLAQNSPGTSTITKVITPVNTTDDIVVSIEYDINSSGAPFPSIRLTGAGIAAAKAVTFTDTGDLVNITAHGLVNGSTVSFPTIVTTTGISINTLYFVVNATANTFQVSATLGGSALALTTNGSGTLNMFNGSFNVDNGVDATAVLIITIPNADISSPASITMTIDMDNNGGASGYLELYSATVTQRNLTLPIVYDVAEVVIPTQFGSFSRFQRVRFYQSATNILLPETLSYPDRAASQIRLWRLSGGNWYNYYTVNLKAHPTLNIAYDTLVDRASLLSAVTGSESVADPLPLTGQNIISRRPALIKAANLNEFDLLLERTYITKSRVVGFVDNTDAPSDGQFGQFGLYIMCEDHIQAADSSSGLFISRIETISDDYGAVGPDAFKGFKNGLWFISKTGIHVLQGSNIEDIYYPILNYGDQDLIQELLNYNDPQVGVDFRNQEVVFTNQQTVTMVYNWEFRRWYSADGWYGVGHKILQDQDEIRLSRLDGGNVSGVYTDAVSQKWRTGTGEVSVSLITNPFVLNEYLINKRIRKAILKARYKTSGGLVVTLEGRKSSMSNFETLMGYNFAVATDISNLPLRSNYGSFQEFRISVVGTMDQLSFIHELVLEAEMVRSRIN